MLISHWICSLQTSKGDGDGDGGQWVVYDTREPNIFITSLQLSNSNIEIPNAYYQPF